MKFVYYYKSNNMKKFLLIIFSLIIFTSCSIFQEGRTSSLEKKVKLWYNKDFILTQVLCIKLYSKGNYDLIIPLSKLNQFIIFNSNTHLLNYSENIKSWVEIYEKEKKIIDNTLFIFDECLGRNGKLGIKVRDLFESGQYMILNNKTNTFVNEVLYRMETWWDGPLAGSCDVWIYIGDFIFWEEHILS